MNKFFKMMILSILIISSSKLNAQNIKSVYDSYFVLKDALVSSDTKKVKDSANDMLNNLTKLEMKSLDDETHKVWMKENKELIKQTNIISKSNSLDEQRSAFSKLSISMYSLIQTENYNSTVFYQRCPMYNKGKGATWLSLESTVKNPYYGSQMLNCGKVIDTIK